MRTRGVDRTKLWFPESCDILLLGDIDPRGCPLVVLVWIVALRVRERVHGAIDMRRARAVVACLEAVAAVERHAAMATSVCVCRGGWNEETCHCSTVEAERARLIDSTKPLCCPSRCRSRALPFSSHGVHPVIDFPTLSILLSDLQLARSSGPDGLTTPTDTGLIQGTLSTPSLFFISFTPHSLLSPLPTLPPLLPNKHTS